MSSSHFHSTSKTVRRLTAGAALLAAMASAAAAGAWAHAKFFNAPLMTASQEQALAGQLARDSDYLRENIGILAERVGELQARVIAMAGLSRRVATAAGVAYTEPEIQASLDAADPGDQPPVMDDIAEADIDDDSAENLGRRLDSLSRQLAIQEDGVTMLDLLLTRRAGLEASLPSLSPVDYPYLSSSFGWRRNPVTRRHAMHEGLDFAAPKGAPIYAASAGIITHARFRSGYGNMVEISHGGGLTTRYAHASALKAKEGDLVEKGQVIALVGSTGRSTGPHLHFEVRMAGHPLDPTLFLPEPEPAAQLIAGAGRDVHTLGTQVR